MKLLNLFKKKEEKPKKEKNPTYEKYKAGLISAEDVMLMACCDFYKAAMAYKRANYRIINHVKDHNEKIPRMNELLTEIMIKGNCPDTTINFTLLQLHKKDKEETLSNAKYKGIDIIGGMCSLDLIDVCKEYRDDKDLENSKEAILHYCSMEGLTEFAVEEHMKTYSVTEEDVKDICPTMEELGLYYDACNLAQKEYEKAYNGKYKWDVDSLFTDDWRLMLPDENGVFHVVEEDYFADYIEMDYKGVV